MIAFFIVIISLPRLVSEGKASSPCSTYFSIIYGLLFSRGALLSYFLLSYKSYVAAAANLEGIFFFER
jgi:hypothetical protein